MNLKDKLSIKAEPVEKALAKYIKIKEPKKLYEAMAHIPLSGGKRLRPVMALLACELSSTFCHSNRNHTQFHISS